MRVENSGDTIHQKMARMWVFACNEVYGCDMCPVDGMKDDKCYKKYQVMNNKSDEWWEKEFAKLEIYERSPQKGITPPKPHRPFTEEVLVRCKECRIQELIELDDWHLVSRVKFLQDDLCGEVVHKCSDGLGEVKVVLTNEPVEIYIERRKKEIESEEHRTTKR